MKAIWNEQIIAESDNTIVIEGNHYFPPKSIKEQYFTEISKTTICPWKGTANYYNIEVDGKVNEAAAWTYHQPKEAASEIKDYVAFWNGVIVTE